MGRFVYTAQAPDGAMTSGSMEAADANEATGVLQQKGMLILALEERESDFQEFVRGRWSAVSQRDLAFFGEQLATLIGGGVGLSRSLTLLTEHSGSRALKGTLGAVLKDVTRGSALHAAMRKHPETFDALWVSLVEAGEMGGQLPRALKQISGYIQARAELQGKVMTALLYPAVLGTIMIGVAGFFVVKIVPTFAEIFASFHLKLPALTSLLIFVSTQLVRNTVPILISAAVIAFILRTYLATEAGQTTRIAIQLRLPFFGAFFKNIMVERLLTTLSALKDSGVSIVIAMSVLEGVFAENILFARALRRVGKDVAGGKTLAVAFENAGVFPSLMVEMIRMGEESGQLTEILDTLSDFYRGQIDQFVRRFSSVIDPIMMVVIGALVGAIVLSIFLPIFQLSQIGGKG